MTNDTEQPEPKPAAAQINLLVGPGVQAVYANVALVRGIDDEILVDFAQRMPHDAQGTIVARVVLTPVVLKHLRNVLQKHVQLWEDKHGEIEIVEPPTDLAGQLFQAGQ